MERGALTVSSTRRGVVRFILQPPDLQGTGPWTNWIGGWLEPRKDPNAVVKRLFSASIWNRTPNLQ
jgi:hypothetical protein